MNNDKRRNYGLYAIAAAIVVVGAVGPVAACPLMMFFMMRGRHSQDGDGVQQDHDADNSLRKDDRHGSQAPAAVSIDGKRSVP